MTFKDLRRLLNERKRREQGSNNSIDTEIDPEIEEATILLQRLRSNYEIAYEQRKKQWFKDHPDTEYLSETYEEFLRDSTVDEWFWYFIERVTSRTAEQRFQDERRPTYGWNHLSNVHTIDEDCKPGCRFSAETGRIEDLEVLEDYKHYQGYAEVRKAWDSIHTK
jgi:hypothetical protein